MFEISTCSIKYIWHLQIMKLWHDWSLTSLLFSSRQKPNCSGLGLGSNCARLDKLAGQFANSADFHPNSMFSLLMRWPFHIIIIIIILWPACHIIIYDQIKIITPCHVDGALGELLLLRPGLSVCACCPLLSKELVTWRRKKIMTWLQCIVMGYWKKNDTLSCWDGQTNIYHEWHMI